MIMGMLGNWAIPVLASILILGGFGFTQEVFAAHITSVPASPFIGPIEFRPGGPFGPGQNFAIPYDTTNNLAYQGGLALPAVGSSSLHTIFPVLIPIHGPQFANDGFYGNGAGWVPFDVPPEKSWLKVDFGCNVVIDTITFGRDRLLGFNDRDPGQFMVSIASNDAVYADGNDDNDASEYTQIVDSSGHFSGFINGAETIQTIFDPVNTRFIKVEFAREGVFIDELQVFGQPNCVVDIDIKPDSVNCKTNKKGDINGVVPIEISSNSVDVTPIDLTTLTLNAVDTSEVHDKLHIDDSDFIIHVPKADICAAAGGATGPVDITLAGTITDFEISGTDTLDISDIFDE